MGIYAVTGAGSGIGAATKSHLEARGHVVFGVDLSGQTITADLSTRAGRAHAVAEIERLTRGRLDGLVAAAGVGASHEPIEQIVALDYFGCVALLEGARGALARAGGCAVAVASNTALALPGFGGPLEEVCLAGDEAAALAGAAGLDGPRCYVTAKRALIRFVRRSAPAWMREGVRLNAVAPGPVRTPLRDRDRAHPEIGPNFDAFPQPAGRPAEPDSIAWAIAFLLENPDCSGSVLCIDGGGDAALRPDLF